jgi:hypothetical protein
MSAFLGPLPLTSGGPGGTPSALTLTNATGLPWTTGSASTVPFATTAAGRLAIGFGTVIKTVDEPKTLNTAPTVDGTLFFPVAASTNYRFYFEVYVTSPDSGTPDIKWGISGPAAPTGILVYHQVWVGTLLTASGGADATAYNTGFSADLSSTSTVYVIKCSGTLRNGSTAGNLGFHWSQNVSSADRTIVKANSFVDWIVTP